MNRRDEQGGRQGQRNEGQGWTDRDDGRSQVDREHGGRDQGWASADYGRNETQYPGTQDYSNRYSTRPGHGSAEDNDEYRQGRSGQQPRQGQDFDRYGGQGGQRMQGSAAGGGGYGGGQEGNRQSGGGYAGGYYGDDYRSGPGGDQGGGRSGGQYGGDHGGGRPWRSQSYNEYESENRLPPIGGGANALPRVQGGGRYTSAGYSSGFPGDAGREFGASYGNASGYGYDQPRYAEHDGHQGRDLGYTGSMYGAGLGGGRARRPDEDLASYGDYRRGLRQQGSADYADRYARGAGGGAFGTGNRGEFGGTEYGSGGESFRGRGPKGYARSDERLKEDLCERLTDDPHVDASDIDIEVRDGAVTLSGSISDRWMKYHVEDIVDHCQGVKDIHNQLRVTRGGQRGERSQHSEEGQSSKTQDNELQNQSSAGSSSRKSH